MGIKSIIFIILRLVLGGMMVFGGIQKFRKPIPSPVEVMEKAEQFKAPEKEDTLQKILYISGTKQTGYFWQVLGICELLFGLLVLLQGTSLIGAVFLLPITLHIFLFHIFLEADELEGLLEAGGLFAINVLLILKERAKWKHLLWIRPV
ncbi:MAG: DoxX family membrane protein [Bacteroidota bacterium]